MRILQLLLSPRVGGAETLVGALDLEFRSRGHESVLAYLDDAGERSSKIARISRLRRRLQESKPDLVLAHTTIPAIYARMVAPRGVATIFVMHSAGDDFAGARARVRERILQRRTTHVVAVSRRQFSEYVEHFPRFDAVSVIENGVRNGLHPTRRAVGPSITISALARVAPQKRPDVWVTAAEQVARVHPSARFVWWGPDEALGASLVNGGGANPHIRFAGPTDRIAEVLSETDLLFHSSDSEAMSITLMEAAASGVPIVCSADVAATLSPDCVARVFDTGDSASAASVLLGAIAEIDELRRVSYSRAVAFQERHSMARCAASYLALAGTDS